MGDFFNSVLVPPLASIHERSEGVCNPDAPSYAAR